MSDIKVAPRSILKKSKKNQKQSIAVRVESVLNDVQENTQKVYDAITETRNLTISITKEVKQVKDQIKMSIDGMTASLAEVNKKLVAQNEIIQEAIKSSGDKSPSVADKLKTFATKTLTKRAVAAGAAVVGAGALAYQGYKAYKQNSSERDYVIKRSSGYTPQQLASERSAITNRTAAQKNIAINKEPVKVAEYKGKLDNYDMSGKIGQLSSKHESKGDSSAVGWDATGGTSYGKYQIASKTGTIYRFLDHLAKVDSETYQRLVSAGNPDSGKDGEFAKIWKQLAAENKIQKHERDFIQKSHYDISLKLIKDKSLTDKITKSRSLQEVLWSTSVHHGGAGGAEIFNKVYKPGMSIEELIGAIYSERSTRFTNSTENTRASVARRFSEEKAQAVDIAKKEAPQVASTDVKVMSKDQASPAQAPKPQKIEDKIQKNQKEAKQPVIENSQKFSQDAKDRVRGAVSGKLKLEDVSEKQTGVDIDGLTQKFKYVLTACFNEFIELGNKKPLITSGYRSIASQEKLYNSMPKGKAAKPGNSLHNYGWAIDINSPDANKLDSLGLLAKYGLCRPYKTEPWHIQPIGMTAEMAKKGIFSADAPVNQDPKAAKEEVKKAVGFLKDGTPVFEETFMKTKAMKDPTTGFQIIGNNTKGQAVYDMDPTSDSSKRELNNQKARSAAGVNENSKVVFGDAKTVGDLDKVHKESVERGSIYSDPNLIREHAKMLDDLGKGDFIPQGKSYEEEFGIKQSKVKRLDVNFNSETYKSPENIRVYEADNTPSGANDILVKRKEYDDRYNKISDIAKKFGIKTDKIDEIVEKSIGDTGVIAKGMTEISKIPGADIIIGEVLNGVGKIFKDTSSENFKIEEITKQVNEKSNELPSIINTFVQQAQNIITPKKSIVQDINTLDQEPDNPRNTNSMLMNIQALEIRKAI